MSLVGNFLLKRVQYLPRPLLSKKGSSFLHGKSSSTFLSTHDYIVCGAGSAGCVLGNRLSADPNQKVLLLEGGPSDNDITVIHMPLGMHSVLPGLQHNEYNWYYMTVPQKNLNNREMYCPRGKVMGGSSSINGMVYVRGHAYDYDRWEREGAKGWSYAHCLPYFKKLENHERGSNDYHGSDGPLHVTKHKPNNPLFQAFLKAGEQAGYPITDNINGFQQEGFGVFDTNIYEGVRCSTANAYINPIKDERKHLQIETGALVTKVLFDGNRAIGVEYLQNQEKKRAAANKEVILCGGSINSPQLLLLSGVGDADELKKHNIPVVCHLPGVGQNLQDHLQVYIEQACKMPVTLWREDAEVGFLEATIEWLRTKSGPGTTSFLETGAFIRSKEGIFHPDIELHFLPVASRSHGKTPANQHGYMIMEKGLDRQLEAILPKPETLFAQLAMIEPSPLRSQSRGTIKLRSADPRDYPLIDFNYMSTESDWKEMRISVRLVREIHQQQAFDEFRGEELSPGKHVQSDKEIDEFIRETAETVYHPTSTCKMGDASDKMAVVGNDTRVFGVEGLCVVDASIMPSVTSGNTNVPTIMIAEKAADHILGNPMLPKCGVPVYKTPEKGQR